MLTKGEKTSILSISINEEVFCMDVKEKVEQVKKKYSETDKKKRRIFLSVIALILILILLLLLHCCGSGDGNGVGGDDSNPPVSSDVGDGSNTASDSDTGDEGEIGYDENLIATWYLVDVALVLSEDGNGSIYYGDSDGGEVQWHTSGNRLTLKTVEKIIVATYVINGDNLILTHSDGKVETWNR